MKRVVWGVLCGILVGSVALAGPKWEFGEDAWAKLSFLGQVHASFNDEAADEEDIYLRRGRVILAGQIMDGVMVFAETDNDNAGKSGTGSVSTDIQDAFVDIRLVDTETMEHWVEIGLILLPFSFENRSSAGSLLGLDYNAETVKFVNTFVWRDYGAELHGNVGEMFSYCVGVFDGYDDKGSIKNADADLRYTGHVALNLIGSAETGWFYNQDRRGSGPYVSLGAGVDMQDKATLEVDEETESSTIEDSEAWVVDLQSAVPVGPGTVTLNGAYFDWDNAVFKGNTAFVEGGVSVGKPMATFKYSTQDPDGGDSTVDYTAGLHYYHKDHNLRGGVEYRWGDSDEQVLVGIQFLL
jgi:hypothetical protein